MLSNDQDQLIISAVWLELSLMILWPHTSQTQMNNINQTKIVILKGMQVLETGGHRHNLFRGIGGYYTFFYQGFLTISYPIPNESDLNFYINSGS